ncbi:hypothetical protein, partial [Klebsiella pneumoniae]|uniref:hypothetical protein n=1 Tax=Klebsiella pneumoniae TaxID=573 RepID=UPI00195391D0
TKTAPICDRMAGRTTAVNVAFLPSFAHAVLQPAAERQAGRRAAGTECQLAGIPATRRDRAADGLGVIFRQVVR